MNKQKQEELKDLLKEALEIDVKLTPRIFQTLYNESPQKDEDYIRLLFYSLHSPVVKTMINLKK